MKSLEARVAALEKSEDPGEKFHRPLSDVERAVRIVHVLTHPESPQHSRLVNLLETQATKDSPPPSTTSGPTA